jgi:hypothetical protein
MSERFPHVVFFASKLIFQRGHYWPRVLHTQAAFALEWRLTGLQTVVLAVAGDASVHPV